MAKRSDFPRIERDLYRSIDPKIGAALRPHLRGVTGYLEPFAGAGDLIAQFPELTCTAASDLVPLSEYVLEKNAFSWDAADLPEGTNTVITNSPWDRKVFHSAINFFTPMVDQAWWVIDYNWCATKQAAPYLQRYVTDILVIGRCKWIPDTNMSGKDDTIWLRTSRHKVGEAINFIPRMV